MRMIEVSQLQPEPVMSSRRVVPFALLSLCLCSCTLESEASARQPAGEVEERPEAAANAESAKVEPVPLNKAGTILLDRPGKRLLLKTEVVLRAGVLEMLCCKKRTKEHESIVAVDGRAKDVMVGLLAIGAKKGSPVSYDPKFTPPTGSKLDIVAVWTDEQGREQRRPAQDWVRNVRRRYFIEPLAGGLPKGMKPIPEGSELRYDEKHEELFWFGPMTDAERDDLLALSQDEKYRKAIKSIHERGQNHPMQADFVFAGSGTFTDENGDEFFQAESGDLICVANFASALVDVSVRSTAEGEGNLLYEAWTERIPPLGTKVTLEITVAKESGEKEPGEKGADAKGPPHRRTTSSRMATRVGRGRARRSKHSLQPGAPLVVGPRRHW
jgi:hypothetical protein